MALAKRFLAKLARIYRRLKQRPAIRTYPQKHQKNVKKCHKSCSTINGSIDMADQQSNACSGDSSQVDAATNATIVRTQAEILPEPRALRETHVNTERIAAGNEGYADVGTQADGGLILENGISKRAFCRQLDNLLKRTLGYKCSTTRVWASRDNTCC